jgi:hypothetical protein
MHKKGTLPEDHIQRLESLGFVWRRFDAAWDEMYQRLMRYKFEYGTCRVSQRSREDPQLGDWVARQRYRRKKGLLSEERIQRLDEIGFGW